MKKYIGTKIIEARPGTHAEAEALKGDFPVEVAERMFRNSGTVNRDGYIVKYPDGYISWSPPEAFEEAYRECDNMPFGLAIEALKKGCRVARKGWNGKGMWLYLTPGSKVFYTDLKEDTKKGLLNNRCVDNNGYATINAHIDMSAADGSVVIGWLASQTDMLADDWYIVE